jgi:uncharacterized protein
MSDERDTRVVRCPAPFVPLFQEAERIMEGFFGELKREPEKGQLSVGGARYVLMRADSFSFELHEELRKTFGDAGARQIRYKIARALGRRDARAYHERLNITDPHMKLALGPVHFAHVGWAFVDIFAESAPSPDENFFLTYSHPYSFEAHAHLDHGLRSKVPVCSMNSGYSSGWCEASYGVELEAQEITCRAMGHPDCIFVMAPPKAIGGFVRQYKEKYGVT